MEAMRKQVSNEAGKAIEAALLTFVDSIKTTILNMMNDKFEELKKAFHMRRARLKRRKLALMINSWLVSLPCSMVKWTL
jgi:hypothetical protein